MPIRSRSRFRAELYSALSLFCFSIAAAQQQQPPIDRIIAREEAILKALEQFSPVVETYIQEFAQDAAGGAGLRTDHYFLGKIAIGQGSRFVSLLPAQTIRSNGARPLAMQAAGFAQILTPAPVAWNRETYNFESARTEFLGEVRCLVFDVSPRDKEAGRFTGRIWVEDRDFTIVRFNGTFLSAPSGWSYAHFDSWRVRAADGLWVPACMYVEEADVQQGSKKRRISFRGQTRFWGYLVSRNTKVDEMASMEVRTPAGVKDSSEAQDVSPLESQRDWQRQAENNILSRLERGGLLAPAGELDTVLNTVTNNLIVTNKLVIEPEVRCRILLTTPLEVFSIGNTIVISRGLLDVLPDESSLAMTLASELAQILLGNSRITKFAFQDLTMFADHELLKRFHFQRSSAELQAGDARTLEILAQSPYKDNTGTMGLFLRALSNRRLQIPNLVAALMGDGLVNGGAVRFPELLAKAPESYDPKAGQLEALPLGGRVKLDPWDVTLKLTKSAPVAILSPRDNIPFEVTPFRMHLTAEGPKRVQ